MIALCPGQVWWNWVHQTLKKLCELWPTPEKLHAKRAKSSITHPWIIRFRSNFVRSLNVWHPKCLKSSRSSEIGGKLVVITNRKSNMGFQLASKSATLNDLERRNGRYTALFHWIWWTCVPTHNRVDLWRNLCTSLLYFVVRVRCRRKESSRSLSHLLMSFLSFDATAYSVYRRIIYIETTK